MPKIYLPDDVEFFDEPAPAADRGEERARSKRESHPKGEAGFNLREIDPDTIPTIETCDKILASIAAAQARIKGQIIAAQERARKTGQFSDADWFRRAHGAKSAVGQLHQEVMKKRASMVRAQRATANSLREARESSAFYEVVSEHVDRETFLRWVSMARERAAERLNNLTNQPAQSSSPPKPIASARSR